MQRTDGTYDLPDEKVSRVWQHEDGAILSAIRKSDESLAFWENRGNPITPQSGRWLPWTPPVFPTRKKMPFRLCRVNLRGNGEHYASFRTDGRTYSFNLPMGDYKPTQVDVLQWLTPEYEDELGARP
jgi:hypothetical protein